MSMCILGFGNVLIGMGHHTPPFLLIHKHSRLSLARGECVGIECTKVAARDITAILAFIPLSTDSLKI